MITRNPSRDTGGFFYSHTYVWLHYCRRFFPFPGGFFGLIARIVRMWFCSIFDFRIRCLDSNCLDKQRIGRLFNYMDLSISRKSNDASYGCVERRFRNFSDTSRFLDAGFWLFSWHRYTCLWRGVCIYFKVKVNKIFKGNICSIISGHNRKSLRHTGDLFWILGLDTIFGMLKYACTITCSGRHMICRIFGFCDGGCTSSFSSYW